MLEKFEDFIADLKNNPTVSLREESVQENRELLEYRNPEKKFQRVYDEIK